MAISKNDSLKTVIIINLMKQIVLVLLVALVAAKDNVLLEKPDPKVFEEVFQRLTNNQRPGDFGYELFSQLKDKVRDGGQVVDIRDHILVLKGHLQDDQTDDDTFVTEESTRINGEIEFLTHQIELLNAEQTFLEEKLNVVNSQSNVVDVMFEQDSVNYAARIGTLHSMVETLDSLVGKIRDNLTQAQVLIEKSDLFENLKKIGKGKHIDVLAELTAHLDHDLVDKILDLFAQLRESIIETLAEDEVKEQGNINLHNTLREEIGSIISNTNTRLQEVEDDLQDRETQIQAQESRLQTLKQEYEDRTNGRVFALGKTQEAHDLLNDNLGKLLHWEELMGDDAKNAY